MVIIAFYQCSPLDSFLVVDCCHVALLSASLSKDVSQDFDNYSLSQIKPVSTSCFPFLFVLLLHVETQAITHNKQY